MRFLDAFERNELEKAMMGRGVDYITTQKIIEDFYKRMQYLDQTLLKNRGGQR